MKCRNCGRNLEEIQATSGGVTYEHKKESRNLFVYCTKPEPEITIQRDTQNVEDVPEKLIKSSKIVFIGKMGKTIEEMCGIIVANSRQVKPDWWAMKMEACDLLDFIKEKEELEKEKKELD